MSDRCSIHETDIAVLKLGQADNKASLNAMKESVSSIEKAVMRIEISSKETEITVKDLKTRVDDHGKKVEGLSCKIERRQNEQADEITTIAYQTNKNTDYINDQKKNKTKIFDRCLNIAQAVVVALILARMASGG